MQVTTVDAVTPELYARIGRLLKGPVTGLRPLPGGHSGITLVCQAHGDTRVVVKVAAPGRPPIGRHDVLRQARAMAHVANAIPVPAVLAVEEGEQPLALFSFAAGTAVEPAIDPTSEPLSSQLVRRRFEVATQLLADLHRQPLGGLASEPVVTPAAELEQFLRVLLAGDDSFRDLGTTAYHSLASCVPEQWRTTLVHGDFRLGNILFVADRPTAVVDWEIWNVGDPRVDLGWLLTFADLSNFPGIAQEGVTLPDVAAISAQYSAAVGDAVPEVDWFRRLGAFRMGAIMAHNLHRHRTGRHVDPFQETLPPTIERLLAVAAGRG